MKELTNDIINDIISSYYGRLKKQLRRVSVDYEQESIHRFRVEYKKLRAFLRMISTKPPGKKICVLKKVKAIYGICGKIRDQQLQLQRTKEALRMAGEKSAIDKEHFQKKN